VLGIVGTVLGIYYAFAGAHGIFGTRSLILFAVAAVLAVVSHLLAPASATDDDATAVESSAISGAQA
jgi:multisubunit Na+/H+ antiporter MnhG subunit